MTYQQPDGISLAAVPWVYCAAFAAVPDGDHGASLATFSAIVARIAAAFAHNEDEFPFSRHHENLHLEGTPNGPFAREVFGRPKLWGGTRQSHAFCTRREPHGSVSVKSEAKASETCFHLEPGLFLSTCIFSSLIGAWEGYRNLPPRLVLGSSLTDNEEVAGYYYP